MRAFYTVAGGVEQTRGCERCVQDNQRKATDTMKKVLWVLMNTQAQVHDANERVTDGHNEFDRRHERTGAANPARIRGVVKEADGDAP